MFFKHIKKFTDTEECRWRTVLKYFGDEKENFVCGNNCDMCVLEFLHKKNVMKSHLQNIVKGTKTKIELLPYHVKLAAESTGVLGKNNIENILLHMRTLITLF